MSISVYLEMVLWNKKVNLVFSAVCQLISRLNKNNKKRMSSDKKIKIQIISLEKTSLLNKMIESVAKRKMFLVLNSHNQAFFKYFIFQHNEIVCQDIENRLHESYQDLKFVISRCQIFHFATKNILFAKDRIIFLKIKNWRISLNKRCNRVEQNGVLHYQYLQNAVPNFGKEHESIP